MTQKHHKHVSFQVVSLVISSTVVFLGVEVEDFTQSSFVSLFRTRCSKWINHITVKHFSEERFAGYLDFSSGNCAGISVVYLIFYISLLSIVI